MQATPETHQLDGRAVRQTRPLDAGHSQEPTASAPPSASVQPILLTDVQAAACMGISRRKFHELRDKSWMCRPIVLGPRIVRWSRSELERSISSMPRQETASEPAQLRRGRIDAMKRGGR